MIKELWQIIESLDQIPDDFGIPYFSQSKYYDPVPLSSENFHCFDMNYSFNKRKICCIDGGNNKIYETPTESIHLLRVYFNLFKGKKRVKNIDPINVYLKARHQDEEVICSILPLNESIPIKKKHYQIKKDELEEGKPISAGHIVRKYLEWQALKYAVNNYLDKSDIIVRDGVLQTSVEEERSYAEDAYKVMRENGVFLVGLAKSCSLYASTGYPLIAAVKYLARKNDLKRWYYHPIAKNDHPDHKGEMYIVKYHPSSKYAFRTEFYREQSHPIEEILGHLAFQASDPVFLGYPYGLVDADKKARVTDEEIEHLKNIGENKMSIAFKDKTNSMNAHDKLSKI